VAPYAGRVRPGALLLLGALGCLLVVPAPAAAAELPLPVPAPPVLLNVGFTADRLRMSRLPPGGTATDSERVDVAVAGDGAPASVEVEQRITLTGRGNYTVVERGPARRARAIGDSNPPTVKLGAVLYAGFVPPGGRELAARLTLDPDLEAARLPLGVGLLFAPDAGGGPGPLPLGGAVPGPGTLTVTVANSSAADLPLPAGDVAADAMAGPLGVLLAAARDVGPRPPVPGEAGLPRELPAQGPVTTAVAPVVAPLRLTGSVRLLGPDGAPAPGAVLTGPGTTPVPGGGQLAGTLTASVAFTLRVPAPGRLALDLTAVPALPVAGLTPPPGSSSWAEWARGRPGPQERAAALSRLVLATAQAVRVRDVSPYLTTDLRGDARTVFRYALAPPPAAPPPVAAPLRARPVAVGLAAAAVLLALGNAELLRRRT